MSRPERNRVSNEGFRYPPDPDNTPMRVQIEGDRTGTVVEGHRLLLHFLLADPPEEPEGDDSR